MTRILFALAAGLLSVCATAAAVRIASDPDADPRKYPGLRIRAG